MSFSYEEWKKKDNERRKKTPRLSVPKYDDWKAKRKPRQTEKPQQKATEWMTLQEFREGPPRSEKARQADADRFSGGYQNREEERSSRARQANTDRYSKQYSPSQKDIALQQDAQGPKTEKARQADSARFSGGYQDIEADRESKARQADSDRFAGRYKSEQVRQDLSILKVPNSQIAQNIENPYRNEKESIISRVLDNAKKPFQEGSAFDRLGDPDFHQNNADMQHKTNIESAKGFLIADNKNDTHAEKSAANLRLGLGEAVSGVGSGFAWLTNGDSAITRGIKKTGEAISGGFEDSAWDEEFKPEHLKNPEWYATQIPRQLPQLLTSIIPGLGAAALTGKINKIKSLPKVYKTMVQAIGGGGVQAAIDATLEAGGVYDEALKRGMTEEQANDAGNETFIKNIALNTGMDVAQFVLALTPLKKVDDLGKFASIGLRSAGGAITEGFQEGAQEGISANALGDEFNWSDPSTIEAMILGGILGGGVTATLATGKEVKDSLTKKPNADNPVQDILNRAIDELPTEIRADFNEAVDMLESSGMPKEEAIEIVSEQLIAQEPAFGEVIDEVTREYIEDKKLELQSTDKNPISQEQENLVEAQQQPRPPRSKKKRQQKKWLKQQGMEQPASVMPEMPLDLPYVAPVLPNIPEGVKPPTEENKPTKAPSEPVDVAPGDTVQLEGTRAETTYEVEAVEGDKIQVKTAQNRTFKVPLSRVIAKVNPQAEAEATFNYGDVVESSSIEEELPSTEIVGDVQLPPRFREDLRETLSEMVSDGVPINEAVEGLKRDDDYYADSPEWHKFIDEEAKAFGYKPAKAEAKKPEVEPKTETKSENGELRKKYGKPYGGPTEDTINKMVALTKLDSPISNTIREWAKEELSNREMLDKIFANTETEAFLKDLLNTQYPGRGTRMKGLWAFTDALTFADVLRDVFNSENAPQPKQNEESNNDENKLITPIGTNKETGRPIYKYNLVGTKWVVIPLNAPKTVNGEPNQKKAYLHIERGIGQLHTGGDAYRIQDMGTIFIGAGKSFKWEGKNITDVFSDIPEFKSIAFTDLRDYLEGKEVQFDSKFVQDEHDEKLKAKAEQTKAKMFEEGNPMAVFAQMKDEWNKQPFKATHKRFLDRPRLGREFKEDIQVVEFETPKGKFFTRRTENIPFINPAPIEVLSKIAIPISEVPSTTKEEAEKDYVDMSDEEILNHVAHIYIQAGLREDSLIRKDNDEIKNYYYKNLKGYGLNSPSLKIRPKHGTNNRVEITVKDDGRVFTPTFDAMWKRFSDLIKDTLEANLIPGAKWDIGDKLFKATISGTVVETEVIGKDDKRYEMLDVGTKHVWYSPFGLPKADNHLYTDKVKATIAARELKEIEDDRYQKYITGEKVQFKEGDKVAFTDKKGAGKTGTITSLDEENNSAVVDVDQIMTVSGGVPIGRKEVMKLIRLKKIENFEPHIYSDEYTHTFKYGMNPPRKIKTEFKGNAVYFVDEKGETGVVLKAMFDGVPINQDKKDSEIPEPLESSLVENRPFEIFDANQPTPKVNYEELKSRVTAKFIPNGETKEMTLVFPKIHQGQKAWTKENIYGDYVKLPKDILVADVNKLLNIQYYSDGIVPAKMLMNTFDKLNGTYVAKHIGKKEIDINNELFTHPSEYTDEELADNLTVTFEESGMSKKESYEKYMGYMRKEQENRKGKESKSETSEAQPKNEPKAEPEKPKAKPKNNMKAPYEEDDKYVYIGDFRLKRPRDHTTAELESYDGLSFEESRMEDKKVFNKYMNLLDQELRRRWKEEEKATSNPPPKQPKPEPTNVKAEAPKKLAKDMPEWLVQAEEAARKRLKERKGRALSGLPMDDLVDYAIIGFVKLTRKTYDFASFSEEMIAEFGDVIKSFTGGIYGQAQQMMTMEPEEINEMIRLASKDKGGPNNDQVETDSDGPLETSGPEEVSGPEDVGATREGSNDSERGNVGSDTGDVPGTGRTESTAEKQEPSQRDVPSKHVDETGGGTKSVSSVRRVGPKTNFNITSELDSFGSPKARFQHNISVIKLLKELEDESRFASKGEQTILARYVGWGGLASAFDSDNKNWKKEYAELKALVEKGVITQKEYEEARKSSQYAHYTSKDVIQAMYQAVENMGLKGGRVLEPGMGIGNFFGLMPSDWKADLTGVEFDGLTGKIAKQLYQKANIEIKPYQDFKMPDGYFDLAIGNPPFSDATFDYKGDKLTLHNYFFVKSLDKIRPGGILAFVTSSGTMNSKGKEARKLMGDKADFLGAIRLPSDAFKANAATEVTTDIIFFQKREEGAKPNHRGEFIESHERSVVGRDGQPVDVRENVYFRDNSDMVLGDLTTDKLIAGQAKPRLAVISNGNFQEQFKNAIAKLPKDIYADSTIKVEEIKYAEEIASSLTGLDEGNFAFENGKIVQMSEGRMIERADITGVKVERLKGLIRVRDAAKEALKLQATTSDKAKIDAAIKKLNVVYDGFVKKFKTINSTATQRPNITAMKDDPVGLSLLQSLEVEENGVFVKDHIFKGPVISYIPEIKNVNTSEEALVVSLSQKGRIDLPYMQKISGLDEKKIIADLGQRIYNSGKGWEIEDEYLSGNVRVKLAEAKVMAESDPSFERNITALEAVIPDDIHSDDIAVSFGSPWIPEEDYTDFLNSFFKARNKKARVRYIKQTGDWKIEGKIDTAANESEHAVQSEHSGGDRLTGLELIELAFNSKSPVLKYVTGRGPGGVLERAVDQDATSLARLKLQELEGEFQDWLFSDKDREKRLTRKYNDEFNAVVLQEYDGSLIYGGETVEDNKPFAGGFNNGKYILRKHQKNVVWRMVQGGNTLLAHVVGAGKTLEMIVAGMEMKRLGMVRKPLYIVPNNLIDQWGREFREAYPNANILMLSNDLIPSVGVTKKMVETELPKSFDLSKLGKEDKVSIKGSKKKYTVSSHNDGLVTLKDSKGAISGVRRNEITHKHTPETEAEYKSRQNEQRALRGAALNKIAVGNYDAIILTHETFKKLPMSPEYNQEFVRQQLADLEFALVALKQDSTAQNSKRTVKQLENAKEKLGERLKKLMDEDGKDIAIPFEMLGIDQIFVDEAHKFKNLQFHTKLTGISGLSNTASQRSEDLFMKAKWLTKVRNGRGVVFATGTPISNTMAEMYTMQRYLQNDRLIDLNIQHFDMWAKMFGQTEVGTEMDVAGGFKQRTRFKRFKNIPELMTMFKEVTDIKTAPMLDLPRPKNPDFKTVVAPISDQQKAYMKDIVSRASDVQSGAVDKSEDNWLKITGDARKMSLDIRLAEPTADEDKESKVNLAVENIYQIWLDGKKTRPDKKGKPVNNLTQLVFADMGTPRAKKQNEEGDDVDSDVEEILSFDVYSDMREKLIKLGIPKNELAFIHEANTQKRKEKLFKDVNTGKVRVLFGSTEKMGAGMNVQERLVALHHVDAPWRPSDVEQREGRMIRQGNRLDDVTVYQYVTEGSFDRIMWDLLKNKAGFIEQVMNGDGSIRVMEDVGPMEFRFADVSAASSGDRTIIDKMNIDKVVKELRGAKEAHRKKIRQNKREFAALPERIATMEKRLAITKADLANRPNILGEKFKIEISGKTYTKRQDAAEALDATFKKVWKDLEPNESVTIGKIGSFDLRIKSTPDSRGGAANPRVLIKGVGEYEGSYNELSPIGSITRIENLFDQIDVNDSTYKSYLERLNDEYENLSQTQDTPFKQEAKLEEALKQQRELEKKMLELNKDTNERIDDDEGGSEDNYSAPKGNQDKFSVPKGKMKEYSQAPKEEMDRSITRPKIMKYIKEHFKVKIDYGKLRGLGVYKNKFAIIRTKRYGDFEILAHELGHRIDTRLKLSINPAIKDELVKFAEANLELPKNMNDIQKAREGAAEYFRQVLYGTQGFEAMTEEERNGVILFTEISPLLENTILEGLKKYEWDDKVKVLRGLIQSWLGRTPQQEWAGITSDFGEDQKPKESAKRKGIKFYSSFLEEKYPIAAAQKMIEADKKSKMMDDKHAYGMAVSTRGSTGRAVIFTEFTTFDTNFIRTNGDFVKTGEGLQAIIDDVEKVGDVNEFGQYLVAKHMYHLKTEKGKINLPITESEETENALAEADLQYGALAERLYSFQYRLLEVLREGNLVSPELVEKLKEEYKYYVPLARVKSETGEKGGIQTSSSGKGLVNKQQGIKRMSKYGSTAMVVNPIETITNNIHLFMGLADHNAVGVAMASWANPDSEFASEVTGEIIEEIKFKQEVIDVSLKKISNTLLNAGLEEDILEELDLNQVAQIYKSIFKPNDSNNEVLVWIEGKPRLFKVHDMVLYEAIVGADSPFLTGVLTYMKPFVAAAETFKYGITMTPFFTVRTFVKSFLQLMWKTEAKGKERLMYPVQTYKSMKDIRKKNEKYLEWMASGSAQSTFISTQTKYLKRKKDEIRLDHKATNMLHGWMKGKNTAKSKQETAELSAYLLKKYLLYIPRKFQDFNDLLDSSMKLAEYEVVKRQSGNKLTAVMASREADMDYLRIGGDFMKAWNKLDPFNNIAFQGLDAFGRAYKAHPVRQSFRGLVMFAIPTFILALLNYDDEEYWELNSYERDLNWMIPKGDGTFYKVPIPFEVGVIFKTIPEKLIFEGMDAFNKQDKHDWYKFKENVRNTMLPAFVPFLANLFYKYVFEKDWTNGREFVPMNLKDEEPHMQYTEKTSEVSKLLGNMLDKSPMVIDETIKQLTGTLGTFGLDVVDTVLDKTGIVDRPDTKELTRSYMDKYFTSSVNDGSTDSVDKFYDQYGKLKTDHKSNGVSGRPSKDLKRYEKAIDLLSDLRKVRDGMLFDRLVQPNGQPFSKEDKKRRIDLANNGIRDFSRLVAGEEPLDPEGLQLAYELAQSYESYEKAVKKKKQKEYDRLNKE